MYREYENFLWEEGWTRQACKTWILEWQRYRICLFSYKNLRYLFGKLICFFKRKIWESSFCQEYSATITFIIIIIITIIIFPMGNIFVFAQISMKFLCVSDKTFYFRKKGNFFIYWPPFITREIILNSQLKSINYYIKFFVHKKLKGCSVKEKERKKKTVLKLKILFLYFVSKL